MRKLILTFSALLALVVAAPALAVKIKSGTATVTPSSAAATALANNGITATAIAPATSADGAFTFPVAKGRISKNGTRAGILTRGGLKLTKGDKSVTARRLVVFTGRKGKAGTVSAQVGRSCRIVRRNHRRGGRAVCRLVYRNVATISDVTITGNTGTGTLKLTAYTANRLNKLAGATFAHKGDELGAIKVTVAG